MTDLRQDEVTGAWAIVSPNRALRPHSVSATAAALGGSNCPFCPGNEALTPSELASYPTGLDQPWQARVIPNLFPILSSEDVAEDVLRADSQALSGLHEVVIETPKHDLHPALATKEEILLVLRIWRERMLALWRQARFKHCVIFKNFGAAAGASLQHPHSQIVVTDRVPRQVAARLRRSRQAHNRLGRSWFEDLFEGSDHRNLTVLETGHFLTRAAFAPAWPSEMLILPRSPKASFAAISDDEIEDLAGHIGQLLPALGRALEDPAFNFSLQTLPPSSQVRHFSWHLQFIPRTWTLGGYELATSAVVAGMSPEDLAARMRSAIHAGHA